MVEEAAAVPGEDPDALISRGRYRQLLLKIVLSVSAVAVLPLVAMSTIAYHQFRQAFRSESMRPMERFVEAGKQSLESFLSERLTALARVTQETPFEELRAGARLDSLLAGMKVEYGGFVDLGLIDEEGVQVAYAGPYALTGRTYLDQQWYREVTARGSTVSDVFLGYRNLPHIVLAIQREYPDGSSAVLRTTIDTDVFHFLVRERAGRRPGQESVCLRCHSLAVQPFGDAFIINEARVLQTPSRLYGDALAPAPLPPLPADNEATGLLEARDERGVDVVVAWARIARSPFTLVLVNPRATMQAVWQPLGRELVVFPAISAILILAMIIVGAVWVVRQMRETDRRRAALYHKMEYTNKLAAIGRLGAGVAHEINNPLSIITQKAGLLNDLLTMSDELPPKEKMLELIDSVLRSAERCGGITHRLLGFAKHMDVQREKINLDVLLREVLGFLDKEAAYRSIRIEFSHTEPPPPIVSDRGQLQQVFLNIINNAFAAVEDGGRIEIGVVRAGPDTVAVSIADDGIGIPESQLEQIFDPFFTTRKGAGTGLGLSITWGIVQKLGGRISVKSTVGEGTCFTVTLPIGAAPGEML